MKTMHKAQRGFTLIELMIVVAIIGILAALAIPAYTDYTIRSKVGEAASLSGSAKTAVDIWYSENGTLSTIPTTHASLGLSNAGSYTAQYVSAVSVDSGGLVNVYLKNTDDDGTALPTGVAGQNVLYVPIARGGNLQWGVSVSGSGVTTKYLPRD